MVIGRRIALSLLLSCIVPALASSALSAQAINTPARLGQSPRITPHADLSIIGTLSGHRPVWATPENDAGAVPDETPVNLQVLLARSPEVQAAFEQRLVDQQNPASPHFHKWLTPAQIGQIYGPNPIDTAAITGWLAGQGLHVDSVAPSGIFLHVSASAATVAGAFHAPLHLYLVRTRASDAATRTYRAPTVEPSIPTAFASVLSAIDGLSEVPAQPLHQTAPGHAEATRPLFDSYTGRHYLSPGDFAAIYDLAPVYNGGINGSGSRVAIIGRSRVNPADVSIYEAIFQLQATNVNVVIPPLGEDPGQMEDADQSEATLDVERVIGTAPGASPDLVISSSASGGLTTAISYNVQTLLDPIMTISFGTCEINAGRAETDFLANLFAQGAAEGISTFVSAGDSGAAACDTHGSTPPVTQFASINAFCASGFVTCVGGTEFNDTSNPAAFWATSNTSRTSALSYIPEGVWNEPGTASNTFIALAGGGGPSIYFPKPAFQSGPGVPADGVRDTPDISFSASGHDSYIVCYTYSTAGPCTLDPNTGAITFAANYGTSASAPSMAGIAALLDQKLGGPQGSLNPLIYRLAASAYSTAFHDATIASSGVSPCSTLTPSLCNNSTASPTALTGGQPGYLLTSGYDLATGWGSLDVANFLAAAASTGIATSTKLTGSSGTLVGSQTLTFNAAVTPASGTSTSTPTGTVQFYAGGVPLGSAVTLNAAGLAPFSTPSSGLPLGSTEITAAYSGDSVIAGSTSAITNLTLNPGGSVASTITLTATPSPTDPTRAVTMIAAFASTGSTAAPTGAITISALDGNSLAAITTQIPTNRQITRTSTLAAGTHRYQATYPGDSTFAPSISAILTVVSTPLPTSTSLAGPQTANTTTGILLTATVGGLDNAVAGGQRTVVNLFDGATLVSASTAIFATSTTSITTATASFLVTLAAGNHSLTAVWPGDIDTAPSTSPALSIVSTAPGIVVTPAMASVVIASPGATATDALTITSVGGFNGAANLVCTVTPAAGGAATYLPTCSLSSSSLTLASEGSGASTLSIATAAPTTSASSTRPDTPGHRPLHAPEDGPTDVLVCGVLALAPALRRRGPRRHRPLRARTQRRRPVVFYVAAAVAILGFTSCGHKQTVSGGTTAGAYTVTVSGGPAGSTAVLSTISVTVQ